MCARLVIPFDALSRADTLIGSLDTVAYVECPNSPWPSPSPARLRPFEPNEMRHMATLFMFQFRHSPCVPGLIVAECATRPPSPEASHQPPATATVNMYLYVASDECTRVFVYLGIIIMCYSGGNGKWQKVVRLRRKKHTHRHMYLNIPLDT